MTELLAFLFICIFLAWAALPVIADAVKSDCEHVWEDVQVGLQKCSKCSAYSYLQYIEIKDQGPNKKCYKWEIL